MLSEPEVSKLRATMLWYATHGHAQTEATPGLNDLATNNPHFPSVEYYCHQLTVTRRVNIFVDDKMFIARLGLFYLIELITS
jgi:hypothetical protein